MRNCLLCITFFIYAVLSVSSDGIQNADSVLRSIEQDVIQNFKVQLQHSIDGARIRRKRQAGLLETVLNTEADTEKRFRVGSSVPEEMPYFFQNNITTWIGIRYMNQNQMFAGTKRGDYVLLDVSDTTAEGVVLAYITGQTVGQKSKEFSFFYEQWFVVLQSKDQNTWIQTYQRDGDFIISRQQILLNGSSDFDLITVRGVHYLVTVTYRTKVESVFTYEGQVRLYHWTTTQFDLIAERTTYGATSVTTWAIDGTLYLAVAQKINDAGNIYLGSPVYLFNAKNGEELMLLDKLKTKDPKRVQHFYVSGNHYLIFIGGSNAEIYWWSNGQFLSWQILEGTTNATDVSVLALRNGEVILVIAMKENILFLTLDSTGHYMVTFTMQFFGYSIESLQIMYDGLYFYALVLSSEFATTYPPPIWKLNLDKYDLPDLSSMDTLVQCLSSLKDAVNQRQNELDAVQLDLDRIWVPGKEKVVTAEVIVNGTITSLGETSVIEQVVISSNLAVDEVPSQLEESSVASFIAQQDIRDKLDDVVFKSTDQEISGTVYFMDHVIVPTLSVPSLEADVIVNDINIGNLLSQTLKRSGDQVLNGTVIVNQLAVGSASVNAINGRDINDLVLLDGSYSINGNWKFASIHGTDVELSTLNSIPLSKVVLAHSDQDISGLKHFSHFAASSISVDFQTNGEYLKDIASRMVTLDTNQNISGRLEFLSPTTVFGDMFVEEPINSVVVLSAWDNGAVKSNERQEITGKKVFASDVTVSGDIDIKGLVNGIDLDQQLVTLSSSQVIYGNITFASDVSFNKLLTGTINGMDLNDQAVLKTGDQFINGHKIFQSSVIAENVDASDGVTIDGIDVSSEALAVVKHIDGVVEDIGSAFQDVVITGDLTAPFGINGYLVSDLPKLVWLKSQPQAINVPVSFQTRTVFVDDVESSLVNDMNLTTDVIHITGSDIIVNEVVFSDTVHITEDTNVAQGKLLAGVDFSTFREEIFVDKLVNDRAVQGTKTFTSLQVTGSVFSENINGFNFKDNILQPSLPQQIEGVLNLDDISLHGDLSVRSLNVDVFNSLPVQAIINSAVYKDQLIQYPISNKAFTNLKANGLALAETSKINGIDLMDMRLRAVTLDEDQTLVAPQSFAESVHFTSSVTTNFVNDLHIQDHVDNVIFRNEPSAVTGLKSFIGEATMQNVLTNFVNGNNLTKMEAFAFSKTKNTDITAKMHFMSDVHVDALYISEISLLDGVSLNDVIGTNIDEVMEQPVVFADVVAEDVFVVGLVNKCPISDISSFGLHIIKNMAQYFAGQTKVGTLRVEGNVIIKSELNEVPLQLLTENAIADSSVQIVNGDLHIHPGIAIENFVIKGHINGTDLAFLMTDAVTKSAEQSIYAPKIYGGDLEIGTLTGEIDAFITDTIDDVNMDNLFAITVRKNQFQVIEGDKIFRNLFANNATVFEYINGIKLPNDVILSTNHEVIPSAVVITKDVQIFSGLAVDGKVDGFNLTDVFGLVTLNDNEEIVSGVTFANDVITGDLSLDGMVNDIPLEMIVTTSKDADIEGSKTFTQTLKVNGDLDAALINGYNLRDLLNGVVRSDVDETMESQHFTQPIYIENNLNVDLVNGISLESMQREFALKSRSSNESMMFYKQLSKDYRTALEYHMLSAQDKILQFAYFILHQEVNLGYATKILTGYDQMYHNQVFSHTMSMWTSQKSCIDPKRCCSVDYTYWLKIDNKVTTTIAVGPLVGRFLPVTAINSQSTNDERLVVWTNTSISPNWCYSENGETLIGTMSNSGIHSKYLIIKDSAMLVDARSFKDGFTYLVAAYFYDSKNGQYSPTIVYRGNEISKEWIEYQVLPTYGALSLDLIAHKSYDTKLPEILLAMGTGMGSYPDSLSSIYRWNDNTKMFDFVQNILSQYVGSILWIEHGEQLLLAVASGDGWFADSASCMGQLNDGQIDIYLYRGQLSLIQSLQLPSVTSMVSFMIQDELYLAAASKTTNTIILYQMQGYSGFKVIQSLQAEDVRHLNTFWRKHQLYLTVSSGAGSSKVLKAVVRGQDSASIMDLNENQEPEELVIKPAEEIKKKSTC